MSPTEKMIGFLRTLTFDGFLDSDEVWLLAKFLNEQSECRQCWPGNLLFPLLQMVFQDGELSETEMACLANAIAAVEQEWLRTKAADPVTIALEASEPTPDLLRPYLPCLDATATVPSSTGEGQYEVTLMNHTCTCPDWYQRREWPVGHLGRCCKHVGLAMSQVGIELEAWLVAVLDDVCYREKGTHILDDWFLLSIPKRKPVLVSGGSGDWHNVYASTSGGYQRYGFNRPENRWSYGDSPRGARQIAQFLRQQFTI